MKKCVIAEKMYEIHLFFFHLFIFLILSEVFSIFQMLDFCPFVFLLFTCKYIIIIARRMRKKIQKMRI